MLDTRNFETLTVQGVEIPIAAALDRHGRPAPLIGDREPAACDHAGMTWSSELDLRCARCGARLFLPPRTLALLGEQQIEAMHRLWHAAGWPVWAKDHWYDIRPERWILHEQPLFARCCGVIPVRHDQEAMFAAALQAIAL
jgi:hypothetical protein